MKKNYLVLLMLSFALFFGSLTINAQNDYVYMPHLVENESFGNSNVQDIHFSEIDVNANWKNFDNQNGEWNGQATVKILPHIFHGYENWDGTTDDLQSGFKMAFDMDSLYFMFFGKDDSLVFAENATMADTADMYDVYINGVSDRVDTLRFHLKNQVSNPFEGKGIVFAGSSFGAGSAGTFTADDINVVTKNTGKGWLTEAAVPIRALIPDTMPLTYKYKLGMTVKRYDVDDASDISGDIMISYWPSSKYEEKGNGMGNVYLQYDQLPLSENHVDTIMTQNDSAGGVMGVKTIDGGAVNGDPEYWSWEYNVLNENIGIGNVLSGHGNLIDTSQSGSGRIHYGMDLEYRVNFDFDTSHMYFWFQKQDNDTVVYHGNGDIADYDHHVVYIDPTPGSTAWGDDVVSITVPHMGDTVMFSDNWQAGMSDFEIGSASELKNGYQFKNWTEVAIPLDGVNWNGGELFSGSVIGMEFIRLDVDSVDNTTHKTKIAWADIYENDRAETSTADYQKVMIQSDMLNLLPDAVNVTGISVSPETLTLSANETEQLTAAISPDNATDQSVTWSSSDPSVATVEDGVVTAVSNGTATITVIANDDTNGTFQATSIVTVATAVRGVILDQNSASVYVDSTLTLEATIRPSDATNQNVTWSSSDESVATVADGVVIGVSEGNADITVTTDDGDFTATCAVTVSPYTNINKLNNNLIHIYPNPAQNTIIIDGLNKVDNQIAIYSIHGSKLMEIKSVRNTVDISSLESGMYFLKVNGETLNFIKK